jgi:quinol monooxygenase YgiN
MSYVVMVHYQARLDAADRVRAALGNMVAPTRAEPGNEAYEVCLDPDDPTVFAIYERYVDKAAFEAHTESSHFSTWVRSETLPNLERRERHDLIPLPS